MQTVSRLMGFIRGNWTLLVWAFIFVVLGTGFGIAIPRMLGDGIDTVIGSGERSQIVIYAIIIVGAGLLRGMSGYFQRYFNEVVSQRASYRIRNDMYERFQRLSFAFHDRSQTGQLMSRATQDVEAVRLFFSMGIIGIVQTVIMVIGVYYMMFSIDVILALITMAFVFPVGWLAFTFGRKIRPIWLKVQQILGFMNTTLEENLAGAGVVKAYSHEGADSQKFAGQSMTLYDEQISAAKHLAFNMPMMVLFASLPTIVILWYGGNQYINGTMSIGDITQFILYTAMLMMPIRRLGMLVNLY